MMRQWKLSRKSIVHLGECVSWIARISKAGQWWFKDALLARVVETGAYILVFSVTNFWSALSVASQIFIWGSHFCGAMKFLALCRWWLEAAFMKCGMGVHWFYWFTMVTRCMRWCCSLTGVSMQIWFAMVHMQIELTLCVMSVPLHLWKRFFVFAKCG